MQKSEANILGNVVEALEPANLVSPITYSTLFSLVPPNVSKMYSTNNGRPFLISNIHSVEDCNKYSNKLPPMFLWAVGDVGIGTTNYDDIHFCFNRSALEKKYSRYFRQKDYVIDYAVEASVAYFENVIVRSLLEVYSAIPILKFSDAMIKFDATLE